MRRLTISGHACVETLALLVTMAWADGRLEESEKAGVRGAAEVFNLTKEMRERLDLVLEKPMPLELILFDTLSPKDRAFAYVAAAWMSGVDEDVDPTEEDLLDRTARALGLDPMRKAELERIARELDPPGTGTRSWANEIATLFKAIPPRLEPAAATGQTADEFEVTFE